MKLNTIYNEECIEGMKRIPDGSVDCIITDPPYNIAKKNNFKTMGRSGIDFGEWDKGFDLTMWIPIAVDKLKKGGNVVIFTDRKEISNIVKSLEECGCEPKDLIRMEKSNPMPRNRDRRFVTDYEVAVYAVKKGAKWTFNRQSDKYDRPLIKVPVTPKVEKLITNHPTQKSVASMKFLIERLSNEEDVIFGPFMGSGTTAIACLNTNRNYIGFELDKEYYDKSFERINEKEKQLELLDVQRTRNEN